MSKRKMKSYADSGERRLLWRRVVVYSIAFFVLSILQCAFFSRLKPFEAVPDIVLGGLCAVIMLDNKKAAVVCAVAAGYFLDAIGSLPPAFSPLFYLICVAVISIISDKMMPSIVSFAVSMLAGVLLGAAGTYAELAIAARALPTVSVIWQLLLPEMLCTFIFCLPVYYLIKLCTVPIESR